MEANRNKRRQFWLGMLLSVACLAAIFFFIRPADIVNAIRTAQYGYLGLTVLGILLFMIFRAVRWRYMLRNQVSWPQVFHVQNIGYMLTMILPFRIGDVARAVLIGSVPPVTLAGGVSTMVVERVLDLLFIVTLLPFTLAGSRRLPEWMQETALASGIVAVAAIVVLIIAANQRPLAGRVAARLLGPISFLNSERWLRRLDDLLAGLSSLTRFKDSLILIGLSLLVWLPIVLAYHSGLLAVNLEPSLAMTGFVMCAAAFSVAAPSSPGQVGVFHAGVIAALQFLGQPQAESASFAFLYHAINTVTMIMLGLVGLTSTGATFGHVVASAQRFMRRERVDA